MLQSKFLHGEYQVNHEEYEWPTSDKKKIYAQKWEAGKKARAGILLIHGLGEHSCRYKEWATELVTQGYSVLTFDFRGHGKSSGKRGAVATYKTYIKDIEKLIEQGKKHFKNIPIFLYGHSLGGNLVVNYVISRRTAFDGIILSSPWFELTNPPSKLKVFITGIIGRIIPGIVVSSGLNPNDMSRILKEVHQYSNDPLIHNKISFKFFREAFEKGKIAKRSMYKINIPMLVFHGSKDNITSCKATREFVSNASNKTTYVEIENGFHELHNDLAREKVFDSIISWLNRQINK